MWDRKMEDAPDLFLIFLSHILLSGLLPFSFING